MISMLMQMWIVKVALTHSQTEIGTILLETGVKAILATQVQRAELMCIMPFYKTECRW